MLDRDAEGRSRCYVEHKASGHRTIIHERNGTFQFDIQVPKVPGQKAADELLQSSITEHAFSRQGTLAEIMFYWFRRDP